MQKLSLLLLLSVIFYATFLPSTLQASDLQKLFGIWGTEDQCSRALITPKGTKLHSPFEVSYDWLGTGDVWCRLTWTADKATSNGVTAFARAQCGEDSVRNYEIKFTLENEELNIIWDIFHKNGPLERCE